MKPPRSHDGCRTNPFDSQGDSASTEHPLRSQVDAALCDICVPVPRGIGGTEERGTSVCGCEEASVPSSSRLVWRRVGAPPVSPFCLFSAEDLGNLQRPCRNTKCHIDATKRASSGETSGCPRKEERLVRGLITSAARLRGVDLSQASSMIEN